MKIELPFPSAKLHAHNKGNWRLAAGPTATARALAMMTCIDALNRKQAERLSGPVVINYVFYVPDLRRRDEANMIQACKPYIDGIVDAKICEGDDWQRLNTGSVTVQVDRDNPRVEFYITPQQTH